MKRSIKKNDDPFLAIPNFLKVPEGIFNDIEHYRVVAERVTKALAASSQKNNKASAPGSSLYDGIRIEFSVHYQEEEIYLDAFSSKIILRAPKRKTESAASLQLRRMLYLEQLLKPVEAMKTIGIAQIYLALKQEGRKKISQKKNR